MERINVIVGGFEVNCSVLIDGDMTWIVDPGQEADRIAEVLSARNLSAAGILLTHAHFDHIGGITDLQKAFPELPVYVHPNDAKVISHPQNQLPPEYPPVKEVRNLHTTQELAESGAINGLEIIDTPGHTPGGVCYYLRNDKLLLSGDTLFAGSAGRTDLPGGDWSTLMQSLAKLTRLPDDTTVIPGHGPQTTIGTEKRSNPFLRQA